MQKAAAPRNEVEFDQINISDIKNIGELHCTTTGDIARINEANWNRQADRRTGRNDQVLKMADALTKIN